MKTWFITGCSSGFGRRLAIAAAERGNRVVATARDPRAIADLAAAAWSRSAETVTTITS